MIDVPRHVQQIAWDYCLRHGLDPDRKLEGVIDRGADRPLERPTVPCWAFFIETAMREQPVERVP